MGRCWVGCVKFSLAGPAIVTGLLAGEMDMSHQFRKPQLLDFFILLVLSVIWGSAFGAIKIAVDETAPFTVVAARTIIGGIGVCVWLMITGSWRLNWQGLPWGRLCSIALLGTLLPFFLISWAEQYVDSSVAGLLNGTGPLVTVLGAHFITRDELLTKGRMAGVLIGMGGVVILMYDGLSQLGGASLIAQLALMLAFSCYAGGNLMVRGIHGITPVQLTGFSLILSSLLALPLAFFLEQPEPMSWSADIWASLLWLGLISTAFAFSLRYVLINRAGAGFLSNVGYTIPMVAVVIGVVLLGEAVTLPKLLALLVILASLYITRRAGVKLRD